MRLIDADAVAEAVKDEVAEAHAIEATPDFIAGLKLGLAYVNTAPTINAEPKWIRCEERLPKKGQVVLVTNGKGNVRCGQFRCTDIGYWVWKGNTLETVIAWMPLPKPYVVEAEAGHETD